MLPFWTLYSSRTSWSDLYPSAFMPFYYWSCWTSSLFHRRLHCVYYSAWPILLHVSNRLKHNSCGAEDVFKVMLRQSKFQIAYASLFKAFNIFFYRTDLDSFSLEQLRLWRSLGNPLLASKFKILFFFQALLSIKIYKTKSINSLQSAKIISFSLFFQYGD